MKYKCYIIDDEPLAIEVLENHISKLDWLEVTGTFPDPFKALDQYQRQPPDLIFLDIDMPGMDGLQFMRSLKNPPSTIFTTAHRNYAFDGFEWDVVDFLLKPIPFERFHHALLKFLQRKQPTTTNIPAQKQSTSVFINTGTKSIRVEPGSIQYLEAMKDYIKVYTNQQELVIKSTMKAMEDLLPGENFMRVHKSYIVAMNKIKAVVGNELEINGKKLPVGRSYRAVVQRYLREHSW